MNTKLYNFSCYNLGFKGVEPDETKKTVFQKYRYNELLSLHFQGLLHLGHVSCITGTYLELKSHSTFNDNNLSAVSRHLNVPNMNRNMKEPKYCDNNNK